MTSENKQELGHDQLAGATGGEVGEVSRWAICPNCLSKLEEGSFTRPGWEEYDVMLKKMIPVYYGGFVCPNCDYNAVFSELPFFRETEDGLEPLT